jgi:hypothetical protein
MRAVDREFPFEPKVALFPRMRILGNDGDEKGARFDLPAYRRIPRIAAA